MLTLEERAMRLGETADFYLELRWPTLFYLKHWFYIVSSTLYAILIYF
jgi:hypothetical protein